MHYYELIFYVAYRFFINVGRKSDPHAKAVVLLSVWDMLYLFVVFALVREFWLPDLLFSKTIVVIAYVLNCLLHITFLIRNKRYLRIYREFQLKREYVHTYGVVIFATYIVAPIALMILFTFTIWRQ
jgi:uncharacterized membrane protein